MDGYLPMVGFSVGRGLVDVLDYRRDPDGIEAHTLNIIKFVDDSLP
jgi:hypothetical protein